MIRIDRIWLATEPLDMRAGPDTCLARVIKVFGVAQPHQAYVFLNKRANRMKVLVHDGFGLWLAARRLHRGRFIPARTWQQHPLELSTEQLQALVVGLPWHQIDSNQGIAVL
ncbi:IS66 family insertion sequence element accessory protein TnpB [Porticoccus sp. W117]|uniref:IS66 family insertion sequence element accessory protein TnpB n=1 Tax=Porticoccus sp. W117 TaxID=3054777 RepID=UPI00259396E7|nr:IS66 family insertion sequence element accessory protein TnpB [Porticoccus sp. W117]MDM3872682.1 IS66 family insertion sequence element accessory protein TnpB [Porticoccus sp. W117]